jgi:hypothetical protein
MSTSTSTTPKTRATSPSRPSPARPAGADPYAALTTHLSLRAFKQRPESARVIVDGIVPDTFPPAPEHHRGQAATAGARPAAGPATSVAPLRATNADLLFPPNAGTTDTNVVNHGGAIASGVPAVLIFWGDAWDQPDNSLLRAQVIASLTGLLAGPYFSAVKDYGAGRPSFAGAYTLTSPNPPATFDDGDVGDALWNLIDANDFPEPDDAGGRNAYIFFMPPGTTYGPGGALGAHSHPTDYDFPFDWDTAWAAWVGFSDLDTITRVFGHELAELASDPEGDAWYVDSNGEEIGDLCNSRRAFVRGVFVEGYWSRSRNACVIPQSTAAQVSPVARLSDQLDLFVSGNDGRIYTSWWHEGSDWSGVNDDWRSIGGFFPPSSTIGSVARMSGNLDLFVVGYDGRVYTSWWHEGSDWSGVNDNWRPIGGFFPVGAPVTAISRESDQLDLFVVGNDGRVYTSWWHEGSDWSGVNDSWRPIGGFFPAGVTVGGVARMTNHLDLFVVGNDGRVYTSWWHEGSDWSGANDNWRSIGGFFPVGGTVSPVARMANHLDLFIVGNDGRVYTSWWHQGAGWSGVNDNWRPIGGFFPTV